MIVRTGDESCSVGEELRRSAAVGGERFVGALQSAGDALLGDAELASGGAEREPVVANGKTAYYRSSVEYRAALASRRDLFGYYAEAGTDLAAKVRYPRRGVLVGLSVERQLVVGLGDDLVNEVAASEDAFVRRPTFAPRAELGFMNSNVFLKEAGRPEIAALILAGGWIEGLYIATQLTKASPNNNELIDRIIDQKLSLVTLVNLLSDYDENADIQYVIKMVTEIKTIYDQIQVVTSKVEPVTNNELKITTLQAKTEIFISDEVFNKLCLKVDSIRNEITGI
jgi:hypothetical protein